MAFEKYRLSSGRAGVWAKLRGVETSPAPGARWLTTAEAATLLKVHERTIQRRASKGKIEARKVSDETGERWEVRVAADRLPTPPDRVATPPDTPNDTFSAKNDAGSGVAGDRLPTPPDKLATPADSREADLLAALVAEKSARIADLQKQLDATNAALEREQGAHAETRRLLAFGLSTPSLGRSSQHQPPGEKITSNPAPTKRRGDALAMVRAGLVRLFGWDRE